MSQLDYQFQDIWLTTREAVKRRLVNTGNTATWTTAYDTALDDIITQASDDVRGELGWLPLPYNSTLLIDYSKKYLDIRARNLWVTDAPLLAVTTLTNGDAQVIASANYTLSPNNRYPKTQIRLLSTSSLRFKPATGGKWEQVISLAGTFGYVPNYPNNWVLSGDTVQDDPLSDSSATLNVSDASANGFEVGQYLQIGSEALHIADINANALTVSRGVLGTTATSHDADTVIRTHKQITAIQRATTEWAVYLWKSKDSNNRAVELLNESVPISQGLEPRIYNALARHAQWGMVEVS